MPGDSGYFRSLRTGISGRFQNGPVIFTRIMFPALANKNMLRIIAISAECSAFFFWSDARLPWAAAWAVQVRGSTGESLQDVGYLPQASIVAFNV